MKPPVRSFMFLDQVSLLRTKKNRSSFLWFIRSSLSQWVHACDALELPVQQREQLDSFIDQLYKDIEKGHTPKNETLSSNVV